MQAKTILIACYTISPDVRIKVAFPHSFFQLTPFGLQASKLVIEPGYSRASHDYLAAERGMCI